MYAFSSFRKAVPFAGMASTAARFASVCPRTPQAPSGCIDKKGTQNSAVTFLFKANSYWGELSLSAELVIVPHAAVDMMTHV
jgi:hypothetical protein